MHTDTALEQAEAEFTELDAIERIAETRSHLLTHISAAVKALQDATSALAQLRSNSVYDVEFVEGRDGRDVATFLDESIRNTRAAYAVVHTVIDQETP
ncbi:MULTISPECIES: hypothetical protein [Mycobacterium]|uniref:hypothetical protein n=1 Tax=Mycobacterium TaxID=1763 RepID=UPI0002B611DA|nr:MULTISPECIES: hypothetical protein [Mycobacterium]AFV14898.1 hypothetical protein OEM_p101180 [Mycobacterium intracellulare subsp. yongonense 05-1390]MBG0730327.1 hypothetical protein [Mycobacterium avium]BDE17050.1 hypothetical protein MKCMC460_59100 [Mycobacterium sp. 20KCMC460]GLC22618.1 hypothetical protein SRL2020472_51890 [Mycobacterium kiyosense]GLC99892.1 hypothetical protein Mkiyose1088_17590 [Mycobacterium kiyosense]